ncbi:MAG TPA: monovalent cation/H(+) antiporter subunit G [Streptosporangiaceae bacterium]|jgi:monovalent cation/proton antiporter MnhG/PhaG subunit|nr:monovalent cation/H(+) antiporter subunit G [Streptosporangiaceae bacterium]
MGVLADIFLAVAVALVLASCVGLLVMRDVYQRLHYVTPLALVAPLLVGLAVLAQSGWSENSSLTWLALLFVIITGPYLSHATIRAAQIRQTGDWRPWRHRKERP